MKYNCVGQGTIKVLWDLLRSKFEESLPTEHTFTKEKPYCEMVVRVDSCEFETLVMEGVIEKLKKENLALEAELVKLRLVIGSHPCPVCGPAATLQMSGDVGTCPKCGEQFNF